MTDNAETLAAIQLINRTETVEALQAMAPRIKRDLEVNEWPAGSREVLRLAYAERMKILENERTGP